ncbi:MULTISPECIES: 2-hydroxyacid dehydrogenase [Streptomyces]|uniref:Lactate dehydrogenase-like 2-hydroxyacid dehydrogenase n=1 Tax=Streptomyces clavifer TaxID=68188 RepID=A0ABS4VIY2_9ACTN|nr:MULTISPECIES: 2-hydroxyacid dehydrogenase [Streptomyces]MBP2363713.1 lactate dehydrogenase-like 2-hydroxyacid dehydrogenase [Streptomyces clavifer]MDX2747312.1 2-hydroxyacid dehydrogenase [Streptomyces sp. NRRL_B-2557]GHB25826.1 hydroxyacid dehydrogenase [Streptomyces clavifer]
MPNAIIPTSTPDTVLQVSALLPSLESALSEHYRTVRLPELPDPAEYLRIHGDEVVAAVTSARVGVSDALMDALPRLGAIVHFGVGYETTDVARARARGTDVSNTPDVLTDCVADLAVGALIDVMRRMSAADRYVRAGGWSTAPFPLASRVTGKRVGILGLGRIGRAVAQRLEGFGVQVAYCTRTPVPGVGYRHLPTAEALAEACDALVVTVAGGRGTEGLVSAAVLEALGPQGYLVNVARGSVVDEPALVAAVEARRIAGAALDVFTDEPNIPRALLESDRVVLLPHIASATRETRAAMGDLALRNLQRFMTEGVLLTPVPEASPSTH